MAKAIEQAFKDRRHLIVEAGTGTGKTLAYLLPALRFAREHKQRVIISTGTKNLQEQLALKDIPFLESLLGPLRVCVMKGRANYLCKQKLYALRDNPILHGLEDIQQFHAILAWERGTDTGDRAEIDALPENSALWPKLDARSEVCLGQTCPNVETCFITGMRRKALESDLIIVNHHLFFADLNIKQQAGDAPDVGILPDAAAVIFDEAHELEDVASQYFGIALSNARFDELARDTETMLRAKQASSSRHRVRHRADPRPLAHVLRLAAGGPIAPRPARIHRPRRLPRSPRRRLPGHVQRPRPSRRRTRPPPRGRRSPRPAQTRRRHPQPPQVPPRIRRQKHRLLDRAPRHRRPPQRRPQPTPANTHS